MYKRPEENKEVRPNTRKIYEEFFGVKVPEGYDVHHRLPVRLGGTHDPSNLVVLSRAEHAAAHLKLYEEHGTPRDLCAYYMLSGRTQEAVLAAASAGGKASQRNKKDRGDLNGFQLFDEEKRKRIAAEAGKIGGTIQKERGIGIHTDEETRRKWAKLGAEAVKEIFADPATQSSRGKRGGVKNKGFKWYHDGEKQMKYMQRQQEVEDFDAFIERTGYHKGARMKISKITKMEPEVTVDIEVADTHTYQLGNGVVSHNTTSKLFGLTEGAHLPSHKFLLRWVQFDQSSTQVQELRAKGYPTRDLKGFSGKTIVGFPTLPTITSIGMPYVITAPEATPAQQYEWLRRLEKYWIGEVGGNQVSYTLKVYTNQVSLEEFRDIVLENQPTVRCCSVMPSKPDHELGYEYLPEEEVSAERFIEIVSGIKDEEIEQAIDMNTLLCASGACPI